MDYVYLLLETMVTLVISIMVPGIICFKKGVLQIKFKRNIGNKSSYLVLRNTSPEKMFVDRVLLYKTHNEYLDITKDFIQLGDNFILEPYSGITVTYPDEKICNYFLQICKKCGHSEKIRRLGVKLVIFSSKGTMSSSWFKIGYNKELKFYTFYDFLWHQGEYYSLRCMVLFHLYGVRIFLHLIICLVLLVNVIGFFEDISFNYEILSFFILVVVSLILSISGFKNRLWCALYSIISSVPIIMLIILVVSESLWMTIIISSVVFLMCYIVFLFFSGWKM